MVVGYIGRIGMAKNQNWKGKKGPRQIKVNKMGIMAGIIANGPK